MIEKYLTFELGPEVLAVRATRVEVILGPVSTTRLPAAPDWVRGVFNQRGRIVPLVELSRLVGVPGGTTPPERRCTVVVRVAGAGGTTGLVGLEVDGLREVVDVAADSIQDAGGASLDAPARGVEGVAEIKGRLTILVDFDRVLGPEERSAVARAGGLATS